MGDQNTCFILFFEFLTLFGIKKNGVSSRIS